MLRSFVLRSRALRGGGRRDRERVGEHFDELAVLFIKTQKFVERILHGFVFIGKCDQKHQNHGFHRIFIICKNFRRVSYIG